MKKPIRKLSTVSKPIMEIGQIQNRSMQEIAESQQRVAKAKSSGVPHLASDLARAIGEIAILACVGLLVFGIAFVVGRSVLIGSIGNDSLLHVANASWFDQFLPEIPNWFPLQGGGISLQRSYSVLPYLIVALTRRLADISLIQAYRLISFLSVPATALSVYVFGRFLLRSRTVGLVAAVFFILSPISWSWIYIQGYLATTVAVVSLPLALLSFDRYLSATIENAGGSHRRIWLAALVSSLSLTILAHVVVGAAAIAGMAFYALFYAAVNKKGKRLVTLVGGVRAIAICGVLTTLLLAFWVVPLATYTRTANPSGEGRLADSSISRPTISEIFSMKPQDSQDWGWYPDSSIPIVVGVLFLFGMAAGVAFSRRALALGLVGLATIGYTLLPELAISLNKLFAMWSAIISVRSLTVLASVVFPIVAAYGASAMPVAMVAILQRIRGDQAQSNESRNIIISAVRGSFVFVAAIFIAGTALYLFRNTSIESETRVNYGIRRSGTDIQDIWGTGSSPGGLVEQLAIRNWAQFEIVDGDPKVDEVDRVAMLLPQQDNVRMDVSPYLGMYAQSLAVQSGASQVNTYIWPANLIWSIWGDQQKVMFIDSPPDEETGTAHTLNEVSNWFGIEFSYLNPVEDRTDIYSDAGWILLHQEDRLELWQYPMAPGLVTLSTRPKVLVISDDSQGAYEMVFRAANKGAIPYKDAFLIKGNAEVDSYSVEELLEFDALFLEGYSYKNSDRAWSTLDEYVKLGGSLFVDTGWQWGVPEWEFQVAPSVLPLESLMWKAIGPGTTYELDASRIASDSDPSDFSPLAWNAGPWSVSVPTSDQVRSFGHVVLSANGHPLVIAGEYGDGRIVWSGMNLVAHALEHSNQSEVGLLSDLVQWLLLDSSSDDFQVSYIRNNPDQIEFNLSLPPDRQAALLWREAYYPAWHAYLTNGEERIQELPILKAGPGFMIVPISGNVDASSIELVWETPIIEKLAVIVSIATMLGLALVVSDSFIFGGKVINPVLKKIGWHRIKQPKRGSVAWLEETTGDEPWA